MISSFTDVMTCNDVHRMQYWQYRRSDTAYVLPIDIYVTHNTACSWAAIWTPLWVYDAIGLYYFGYIISLGKVCAQCKLYVSCSISTLFTL
jgi:hypothetical protein